MGQFWGLDRYTSPESVFQDQHDAAKENSVKFFNFSKIPFFHLLLVPIEGEVVRDLNIYFFKVVLFVNG